MGYLTVFFIIVTCLSWLAMFLRDRIQRRLGVGPWAVATPEASRTRSSTRAPAAAPVQPNASWLPPFTASNDGYGYNFVNQNPSEYHPEYTPRPGMWYQVWNRHPVFSRSRDSTTALHHHPYAADFVPQEQLYTFSESGSHLNSPNTSGRRRRRRRERRRGADDTAAQDPSNSSSYSWNSGSGRNCDDGFTPVPPTRVSSRVEELPDDGDNDSGGARRNESTRDAMVANNDDSNNTTPSTAPCCQHSHVESID